MDGQELIERRGNWRGEQRRMEEQILRELIDLGKKVSAMEATQKELIESVHKSNNHNQRLVSLEEFRERQMSTCAKIQDEKERKKFPWTGVLVGIIVALSTSIMNYFVFK